MTFMSFAAATAAAAVAVCAPGLSFAFTTPIVISTANRPSGAPQVTAYGNGRALIVWKEFDGEKTTVNLMTSRDDGATWSPAKTISSTMDTSDHPLLVSDGRRSYLSWMTKADGYRIQPIEDEP